MGVGRGTLHKPEACVLVRKKSGYCHLSYNFSCSYFRVSASGSREILSRSAEAVSFINFFQRDFELVNGGFHLFSQRAITPQRMANLIWQGTPGSFRRDHICCSLVMEVGGFVK